MRTARNKKHQKENSAISQDKVLLRAILRVLLFLIFSGVTFFGSYGSLSWGRSWLLLGIWVVYYALLYTWGRKVNPEVVLERASTGVHSPNPQWDRNILKSYLVISVMMNVTAGLDAGRFGWSEVPAWLVWSMLVFAMLANLVPLWIVLSNPFASSVVRIQAERSHQVVTNGPYAYIRHPMYFCSLLYAFSYPLFLGSYWALIPGALIAALMIARTHLEDEFLQENLDGYKEYTEQVRWRLLPGIW
jgi:protein-S-isoprenylcysteine O-methyltransferase Ste14